MCGLEARGFLSLSVKASGHSPSIHLRIWSTGMPRFPYILSPLSVLTRREREVFFLVAAGNTSKKIAELLDMSLKTAENHRSNIYKKLNLSSSAELIRMAGKAGLLE